MRRDQQENSWKGQTLESQKGRTILIEISRSFSSIVRSDRETPFGSANVNVGRCIERSSDRIFLPLHAGRLSVAIAEQLLGLSGFVRRAMASTASLFSSSSTSWQGHACPCACLGAPGRYSSDAARRRTDDDEIERAGTGHEYSSNRRFISMLASRRFL